MGYRCGSTPSGALVFSAPPPPPPRPDPPPLSPLPLCHPPDGSLKESDSSGKKPLVLKEGRGQGWRGWQKCGRARVPEVRKSAALCLPKGRSMRAGGGGWADELGGIGTGLLISELAIKSVNARRTLVQAVCREIEGLGCLGPPSTQAVSKLGTGEEKGGERGARGAAEKVHADAESFFGRAQDSNDDGQVSEEEFVNQQSIRGAGIKEAYSCLDADANGQITRQEMWELKNRFWRSKLSRLSAGELLEWLASPKCVDTDMTEYLPAFASLQVGGLSMWTYGIQNPILMKAQLGIESDMKRAYVSESVCREIMEQGCLHGAMWQGWFGGWNFWLKWGAVVLTQGQHVVSVVIFLVSSLVPLYMMLKNTRSMIEARAMVSEGHSAVRRAWSGTGRGKKKGSPRVSAAENTRNVEDWAKSAAQNLVSDRPRTGGPRSISDAGASRSLPISVASPLLTLPLPPPPSPSTPLPLSPLFPSAYLSSSPAPDSWDANI